MGDLQGYDQYPVWMLLVSNLLSLLVYVIGAAILYRVGLVWVILYLLFILVLEFRFIKGHCVDCYYYGRTCAFGKGRLICMFFPRGKPEQFNNRTITLKDIVPDFLVFIIPVLIGIGLLIYDFSWILLVLIGLLLIFGFAGNAVVRGQIACRYCRQREIGCPAQRLFKKP